MRKIVYLSGTRADFGKLKSLIEITQSNDEYEVHIFATGKSLGIFPMQSRLWRFRRMDKQPCGEQLPVGKVPDGLECNFVQFFLAIAS